MNKINVASINEALNIDGDDFIDDDESCYISVEGSPHNATKGRYWVNNGIESMMIFGEIPDGWVLGRGKVHSDKALAKISHNSTHSNGRTRTYVVKYRDGKTETIKNLNKWCGDNGYGLGSIKNIVRRSKNSHKIQFYCYNSKFHFIESILPV